MGTEAEALAENCLRHLAREEAALRTTLELLQVVRAAALAGDLQRLEGLRSRQNEASVLTDELRAEREGLRVQIVSMLPARDEKAPLEILAEHLGGHWAERIRQAGGRVRSLATKVDQLNLANATLLQYGLGFARRVLRVFTGGGTPAESYGPDGTVMESPCGSLLSAKG